MATLAGEVGGVVMIPEDKTFIIALKTHTCANGETVEVNLVGCHEYGPDAGRVMPDLSPRLFFNKNESSLEGAFRALIQTMLPEDTP